MCVSLKKSINCAAVGENVSQVSRTGSKDS